MNWTYVFRYGLVLIALVLFSSLAHGQAPGGQNDVRDIANSLTPGKPHLGKEKKEEVDPRKLPSKRIKDPTFEGGLADIGVDWNGDKMGKPHGSGATDPKSQKQSGNAGGEKDSK